MADPKNNPDEPSIEEILSSIREIISDEDEDESIETQDFASVEKEEFAVDNTVDDIEDTTSEDDDVLDLSAFAQEDATELAGKTAEDEKIPAEDPFEGINLTHPPINEIDMVDAEPEEDEEDSISDILGYDDVNSQPQDIREEEFVKSNNNKDDDKDFLIDKVAEGATVSAMARLAENISLARNADGVTLEDIVRDLLRPMLKDWLDDNLPDIIERLVSQELERLAQKAVRK